MALFRSSPVDKAIGPQAMRNRPVTIGDKILAEQRFSERKFRQAPASIHSFQHDRRFHF